MKFVHAGGKSTMQLKLLSPTRIVADAAATKVIAEAENGFFCLLPRHVDFVAALVPSILAWWDADGHEHVAAVDAGTLVKCGDEVLVSVRDAVVGENLETLQDTVENTFLRLTEHERQARGALARLEAGALRRFTEVGSKADG